MKASDLRIGNIVSVCYEKDIIPDTVIVLEPEVVHLSNREYPDSDRDIIGVPLSTTWLKKFEFKYNPGLKNWGCKNILIKKLSNDSENYWVLQSKSGLLRISFVHELQNLLHVLGMKN